MAHIYNGILLRHKKKRNGVICSEVDGVRVIQSEVSQKEKNKYRMITHIYGILKKNGSDEPRGTTAIKTQT